MEFSEWLLTEMKKREWSNSDLARKAGLSRQAIGYYLEGRQPNNDAIKKLASAFDVTIETVMRQVNILPSIAEPNAKKQELDYLLSRVPESVVDDVLEFTRFITRRKHDDKKGKG